MTLDIFQMQQCENQGRLFESLDRRDIDAKAFIKAFMNSRAAAGLDSIFDHFQWAGNEYIYEDVVEEFGLQPTPNPPRYNTEALYYGGYITRFWHYLTGETMRQIYAQQRRKLGNLRLPPFPSFSSPPLPLAWHHYPPSSLRWP